MGSWDVGCAVSGLAIGGEDEAYVIPLVPENCQLTSLKDRRFHVHTHHGRGNLYSNGHYTYSDDLYQPLLPILGTYSTYGALESIAENDYTLFLEEWFGISIKDIVKIITMSNIYDDSGRKELFDEAKALEGKEKQRFEILTKLSSMFVHKDIYQHLANRHKPDEMWGWWRFTSLSDAYDKLHQELVAYDKPPEVEGEDDKEKGRRLFRSGFLDPLQGNPPITEDEVYHLGHFLSYRWYTFRAMFRESIKQGQLKQEICDFLQFDSGLSMCNRIYFPSVTSGQESKNEANIDLYRAALKVIGKNIAQIAEENITEDKKCRFCEQMKTKYVEDSCKECHLQYCGW